MILPKMITRSDDGIKIDWSSGAVSTISSSALRQGCPCASCREERGDGNHSKPISQNKPRSLRIVEHSAEESLKIESVRAIGNYAINIIWKDGHSTGIYPYSSLIEMGLK